MKTAKIEIVAGQKLVKYLPKIISTSENLPINYVSWIKNKSDFNLEVGQIYDATYELAAQGSGYAMTIILTGIAKS